MVLTDSLGVLVPTPDNVKDVPALATADIPVLAVPELIRAAMVLSTSLQLVDVEVIEY
jgi:hypothetical protein